MKKLTIEEYMFPTEDVLVNDWLNCLRKPGPVDCGEYTMCQKLNEEQAEEIMYKVADTCGFDLIRRPWKDDGMYYNLFISTYTCMLLASGEDDVNNWREMLWGVLSRGDQEEVLRRMGIINAFV